MFIIELFMKILHDFGVIFIADKFMTAFPLKSIKGGEEYIERGEEGIMEYHLNFLK